MIELKQDRLVVKFPDAHPNARLRIDFQRTLRIPDDGRDHPLPPGLGRFPVRHVDDFGARVPGTWTRHGGVMLPMYQSEAMWLNFSSEYPFALKVATGKINAVTGEAWMDGLNRDPQDYVVVPEQPWLDGYCVEKGVIRQFVAMPLGSGYSVEEQLTGAAEHGGVQLVAYPMKAEVWERLQRERARDMDSIHPVMYARAEASPAMGLAPGGRMRQEIYDDRYGLDAWDLRQRSRCFVHLADAVSWRAITGEAPRTTPPTAAQYSKAGLPWFEYYAADLRALESTGRFGGMKSVHQMGETKGETPLPENEPADPERVVRLGRKGDVVREGRF